MRHLNGRKPRGVRQVTSDVLVDRDKRVATRGASVRAAAAIQRRPRPERPYGIHAVAQAGPCAQSGEDPTQRKRQPWSGLRKSRVRRLGIGPLGRHACSVQRRHRKRLLLHVTPKYASTVLEAAPARGSGEDCVVWMLGGGGLTGTDESACAGRETSAACRRSLQMRRRG